VVAKADVRSSGFHTRTMDDCKIWTAPMNGRYNAMDPSLTVSGVCIMLYWVKGSEGGEHPR